MTVSTESSAFGGQGNGPSVAGWRERVAGEQERALPDGAVTVSCSAPIGTGGLGRHLQELLDALARRGQQGFSISGADRRRDPRADRDSPAWAALAARLLDLPLPLTPGLRARASAAEFDAYAARRLPAAEHLIAFNGQALIQFEAASGAGYRSVALVSANSHMRRVIRQHERARRMYPLEGSWASRMLRRNLREYERSAQVYVASRYSYESFLEEGFPQQRLAWFPLTPHPRFDRSSDPQRSGRFEIVYTGSLAVHKGVPLLIDAVRRLPYDDLRLTLVGGWGSRGMRRFVEGACADDRRIEAGPGDPLPRLQRATIAVHAAFEDGFGYAPAEALACGVPVIVSDDTGMKDLIESPRAGLVLPTGDLDALASAIDAAYRGELFEGR
ncbi:MAG TPA: glycosyltransferase family 4 protein [Solirubrobacteraceae bacterium]|jgi:glycosyltransferase involved in cell wall biosynthesis